MACAVASISIPLVIHPALAASFTVQNGQVVGQQSLTTPGDVGTIDAGGTIIAGDGVIDVGTVNNLTVINNGTIVAGADGIDIDGDNGVIINNGSITASDRGLGLDDGHTVTNTGNITSTAGDGILADNNSNITNTGTITAADEGVEIDNDNVLNNSGSITSSGGEAIEAQDNNSISNSGTIQNTGSDDGIRIGNDNTVINSGLITSASNDGIDGVDNNTVTNTGTIRGANGAGGHGIDFNNGSQIINSGLIEGNEGVEINSGGAGAGGTIVNSGTIRSLNGPAGTAIQSFGTRDDTLTLLPGSIIEGAINLGGGVDTLNVGNGLSLASTFTGGPEIVNANGAPFVQVGNQVVVLDPTLLAAQDEILSDLTSGIFNSIHARLNGARGTATNGSSRFAFGGSSLLRLGARGGRANDNVSPATSPNTRLSLWAHAFGGLRNEDANGATTGTRQRLIGGIVGVDGAVHSNVRVGVFVGGAHADVETTYRTQETRHGSVLWRWLCQYPPGRLVCARDAGRRGRNNYDSSRQVANNTVVSGLETARAEFDGIFISPELTVGTTMRGWRGLRSSQVRACAMRISQLIVMRKQGRRVR